MSYHFGFLILTEELIERSKILEFLFLVNEGDIFGNVSFAFISESTNSVESLHCLALVWEGSSKNQSYSFGF